MLTNSEKLYQQACQIIPGGVNSPVRAFKSVKMNPIYIKNGKGAYIYDADGNKYTDFVGSWGPLILGHADDDIVKAITDAAVLGTSFGACTEKEIELAQLITSVYPSMEMVRMVNSGTEATMSAIRLARGFTGRSKIIKFEGCYHGHADSFLIKAGSGVLTLGIPGSPGVTDGVAQDTLIATYNDIQSVEKLIDAKKGEIAALILEPVMGNAGVILPQDGFLQQLRELTAANGILLIFDEVITGFRVALGGAQQYFNIKPDLTCLGKIIGGGLPVGAFGGRRDIMEYLAPLGPVYQAGTLAGNPLAMAAGIAMVKKVSAPGFYENLEAKAQKNEAAVLSLLKRINKQFAFNRVGSMSCLFFSPGKVTSYAEAMTADTAFYAEFFKKMLNSGIYLAPSQFEASFVSSAHSDADLEHLAASMEKAIKELI
ncbi:MAG: glutamate-1-semialdehyde 2,1-aminomutase [Bacteroidota bacterium]|nr:glutamate-1-semialdehyde 2,1-aminomutase [Bacteroidota bacterium]